MPVELVECVPNFSEVRRPEVIAAVVDAARAVEGARVLNPVAAFPRLDPFSHDQVLEQRSWTRDASLYASYAS